MIEVFSNATHEEIMVRSNCTDLQQFLGDLSTIMARLPKEEVLILEVMERAMPIAFKLAGYKADDVYETRSLACGHIAPGAESSLVNSA